MWERFWRRLTEMKSAAPVVFWAVIVLSVAELSAVLLGPLVVPDHIYLRSYLSDQAETALTEFYGDGSATLVFDDRCGWRNRPGFRRDKWEIDQYGGRTTRPIALERGAKQRVLFLGSSLINGGNHLSVDETISAAIEDQGTEALNLGTMLFSVDQSLLLYQSQGRQFASDVVVVGLSGQPTEGLVSRFVPFYRRSESNMPYFRPRFVRRDSGLVLVPVPEREVCAAVMNPRTDLPALLEHDGYYREFTAYCRYGFTPVARMFSELSSRAANLFLLLREEEPDLDLLIALMHRLDEEVQQDQARIVFLLLPDQETVAPGWRARLPDQYGNMLERLKNEGFDLVDGRRVLRESPAATWQLFHKDGVHYTAEGNQVLAAALKPMLRNGSVGNHR